ncbi:MAG TPA: nickel ABC transporter permease [Clostridiales bacterium]|jgi:hypothetical protein|nr:nickel ABC transporter permease [Clostridiales bacterium]
MKYLYLIILIILSVFMIFKPTLLWKIEHFLSVKNGEPTDLYITLMRIGGTFFLISSVVMVFLFWLK